MTSRRHAGELTARNNVTNTDSMTNTKLTLSAPVAMGTNGMMMSFAASSCRMCR